MMTVHRMGVFSAAKILGVLYALLGLIVGLFFTCFSLFGALAATSAFGDSGGGALGALFGVGAIIILPIFYGVIGFIGGALMAFLYNIVSGWVGGIEIDIS